MGKIEIILNDFVIGDICNLKGDTIAKFEGVFIGFTKTKRYRIQNSEGIVKNFSYDNIHNDFKKNQIITK